MTKPCADMRLPLDLTAQRWFAALAEESLCAVLLRAVVSLHMPSQTHLLTALMPCQMQLPLSEEKRPWGAKKRFLSAKRETTK